MKFQFDDSGLRELLQRMRNLKDKEKIPLGKLFSNEFMMRHTKHASIEAFSEAAGIATEEQIRAILDNPNSHPEFNQFVADHSHFDSFSEMAQAAGAEYLRKQLGL